MRLYLYYPPLPDTVFNKIVKFKKIKVGEVFIALNNELLMRTSDGTLCVDLNTGETLGIGENRKVYRIKDVTKLAVTASKR